MTCNNCGAPLSPSARFCAYCGRPHSSGGQVAPARGVQRYGMPALGLVAVIALLLAAARLGVVLRPPAPTTIPATATPAFQAAPPPSLLATMPPSVPPLTPTAMKTVSPTWPIGNATPANPRLLECRGLVTTAVIPLNAGLTILHGQTAQKGQFGVEIADPNGKEVEAIGPFDGPGYGDAVFQAERAGAYTVTIRSDTPSCLVGIQQPGRYEIVVTQQGPFDQLPRSFTGAFGPNKTEFLPLKRGDLTLTLRHRGAGAFTLTIYGLSSPWVQEILQQPTPGERTITVAIPADGVYLLAVEMGYDRDNQWVLEVGQ